MQKKSGIRPDSKGGTLCNSSMCNYRGISRISGISDVQLPRPNLPDQFANVQLPRGGIYQEQHCNGYHWSYVKIIFLNFL